MNKEQAKGKFQQFKGKMKKAWGEVTDNDEIKAEGTLDKLSGTILEKAGDVKEAILDKVEVLKEAVLPAETPKANKGE